MLHSFKKRLQSALDYQELGPNLDSRLASIDQQIQKQFLAELRRDCRSDPSRFAACLNDFGFRVYSQYEEDGLLLYIFAAIGFQTKRVVEMCAGDGRECMATNLIVNHHFDGLLFDGNAELVASGQEFFRKHKDTFWSPPKFQHAWITTHNVNRLLKDNGFTGEVDLLSLDLDGIDYWIWKSIDVIQPRVCIFETNNIVPTDLSLTVPYSDEFNSSWGKPTPYEYFRSMSLRAMTELSLCKGYRLIGSHRHGFNVLFMRNDVGTDVFPAVSMASIHGNSATRNAQELWAEVQTLPWMKV
jgi:hypothetical protein